MLSFFYLFSLLMVLFLSGFFSGSETGVLSCSKLKVQNNPSKRSRILNQLLENKQKTLIVLLVGNNVINTLYTLVGERLVENFWQLNFNNSIAEQTKFLVATVLLTPLIVVFGEIFPKTLFRHYSFSLSHFAAPWILFSQKLFSPISWPFLLLTHYTIGSKVTKVKYNRDTIHLLMERGTQTGNLYNIQERLIRNILSLPNQNVSQIAKPIPKELCINTSRTISQALKQVGFLNSDILFVKKGKKILNIIHVSELNGYSRTTELNEIALAILKFPAKTNSSLVLQKLIEEKKKSALIENGLDQKWVVLDDLITSISV